MAALQCEICGGKLIGKPGGIFECDSCGMEYSTDWAKAKIQEIKGTVKVEGTVEVSGTVNVDGAVTKDSLLKRAELCCADQDWKKASKLIEQILNIDPECRDAYLYKLAIKNKCKTLEDLHAIVSEKFYDDAILNDSDMKKAKTFDKDALIEKWIQDRKNNVKKDLEERKNNQSKLLEIRKRNSKAENLISMENWSVTCVRSNGKIEDTDSEINNIVKTWSGIIQVVRLECTTIGLRVDGTIEVASNSGIKIKGYDQWRKIASIHKWGYEFVVGLRTDGTVDVLRETYVDDIENEEFNRLRKTIASWKNIDSVHASDHLIVGVKNNGTMLIMDRYHPDKCNKINVDNMKSIAITDDSVFIIKNDGTVKKLMEDNSEDEYIFKNVVQVKGLSDWKCKYIGLNLDGTVVTDTGNIGYRLYSISGWRNIVSIVGNDDDIVGIKCDGTVVAYGKNFRRVYSSDDGEILSENDFGARGINEKWKNIVAVYLNNNGLIGIKSDGTVISETFAYRDRWKSLHSVDNWKLFNNIETLEDEKKIVLEEENRLNAQANAVISALRDEINRKYKKSLEVLLLQKEVFDNITSKIDENNRQINLWQKQIDECEEERKKLSIFSGKERKQIEIQLIELKKKCVDAEKDIEVMQKNLCNYQSKDLATKKYTNLEDEIELLEEKIKEKSNHQNGSIYYTYEQAKMIRKRSIIARI